jgi:hypothetical protein
MVTGMYVTKHDITLLCFIFLFRSLADKMSTAYSKPSSLHSAI